MKARLKTASKKPTFLGFKKPTFLGFKNLIKPEKSKI